MFKDPVLNAPFNGGRWNSWDDWEAYCLDAPAELPRGSVKWHSERQPRHSAERPYRLLGGFTADTMMTREDEVYDRQAFHL